VPYWVGSEACGAGVPPVPGSPAGGAFGSCEESAGLFAGDGQLKTADAAGDSAGDGVPHGSAEVAGDAAGASSDAPGVANVQPGFSPLAQPTSAKTTIAANTAVLETSFRTTL